jgi:agmatinase
MVLLLGEDEYLFADATTGFDESRVVIFGVPFDGTSSHRTGSAKAPAAIRHESYNFESFLKRYNFELEGAPVHDLGDTKRFSSVSEVVTELPKFIEDLIRNDKFPIALGGEHSLTFPIVKSFMYHYLNQKFGVIFLDAHADFRDSYIDEKYSHACACRRVSELVGIGNVVSIGVRSYSSEESKAISDKGLKIFDADSVNEQGIEQIMKQTMDYLSNDKIYLSIDMDVIDPAYAPGVGNPETFGLTPAAVRYIIETLGPNLIGADIVEVSPPYDNGNTAALAAQLVQIIIAQVLQR